jgi:hypothetical protein
MRSSWFVAAVLVALAAAGWAFYTLSVGAPGPSPEPRATTANPERPEPAPARRVPPRVVASEDTGDASGEPPPPGDGADGSAPSEQEPPARGGPPRVQPQVALDQARADFQAVLEELDELIAAERRLDNTAWVELYKRGNDALVPLQQHLDWKVPAQAEELRTAQTNLREKLHAVAPSPVDTP